MTEHVLRWCVALASLVLGACASHPPYRIAYSTLPAKCADWYDAAKESNSPERAIQADLGDPERGKCWLSSTEPHHRYDLFTAEFDDQGWLARERYEQLAEDNRLQDLIEKLRHLTDVEHRPLSLVVYTHGWHHSARPDDNNVIAFRRLLEDSALLETKLCLRNRVEMKQVTDRACTDEEDNDKAVEPWKKRRRVVGVYVGWRSEERRVGKECRL